VPVTEFSRPRLAPRLRYRQQGSGVTNYIWDAFGHIIAEHNATGGGAQKQYIWLG
jgi:YD repeat-containing protein